MGIWKSREPSEAKEGGASDYFLAGRGLTWWLVGFSLIAANISTEQFVGMTGGAADSQGLAIASWEWIAAISLVVVAFWFLPRFLKAGLYTIPEFLEYRYGSFSRFFVSGLAVVILVLVNTSAVIYSGAKFVSEYYNEVNFLNSLTAMCWAIGIFAALYVFIGGLKACAWTDLIWGAALIVAGAVVLFFCFQKFGEMSPEELIVTKVANSDATIADLEEAGPMKRFMLLNDGKSGEAVAVTGPNGSGGKMHMVRPKDDPNMPWTALLIGIWIPNFFYWGLNQYIVQRTLGSKSLAEGQKGIVFAAFMKLIIPFVVVIPGIMAFNLFSKDLHDSKNDERNVEAVAEAGETSVFTIMPDLVRYQPELAEEIYQKNLQLAGIEASAEVNSESGERAWAGEINRVASVALARNEAEGLKGEAAIVSETLDPYSYDSAFPVLVRNLIKPHPWISWFVLAALSGAVISSLASMLNSASTMATMDFYSKLSGQSNPESLIRIGRILVVVFVVIAAVIAPILDNLGAIFKFIQEFQGFVSPGILVVFLFGFFSPKTPRSFGLVGIVASFTIYGILFLFLKEMAFLNRMALTVGLVAVVGLVLTIVKPLPEPVKMPVNEAMSLESSKGAKIAGIAVCILTVLLYVIFK